MNALLVLYAGCLSVEAFEPLANGKNSVLLTLEQARNFPSVAKIAVLAKEGSPAAAQLGKILPSDVIVECRPQWTVKTMLDAIAAHQDGLDQIGRAHV